MGWPWLPLGPHVGSAIDHDGAVSLNALAVKGRSSNAPLAPVHFTIAGDEPLAQQNLHPPLGPLLDEVLRLVDQDLVDKIRLVDKNDVREPQAVVGHPPIGLGEMLKQRDRIPRLEEAAQQIERQIELQPRRKAIAIALQHGPRLLRCW